MDLRQEYRVLRTGSVESGVSYFVALVHFVGNEMRHWERTPATVVAGDLNHMKELMKSHGQSLHKPVLCCSTGLPIEPAVVCHDRLEAS